MLSDILPTGFHGAFTRAASGRPSTSPARAPSDSRRRPRRSSWARQSYRRRHDPGAAGPGRELGFEPIDSPRATRGPDRADPRLPEVDAAVDAVGFEARGHGNDADPEAPATVLNSLMEVTRAAGKIGIPGLYVTGDPGAADGGQGGHAPIRFGLGWAKSHSFSTGQSPVLRYHRCLMQAILTAARNRRRGQRDGLSLDEAPQGYQDFDSGAAKKFVLDPHGLVKPLTLREHAPPRRRVLARAGGLQGPCRMVARRTGSAACVHPPAATSRRRTADGRVMRWWGWGPRRAFRSPTRTSRHSDPSCSATSTSTSRRVTSRPPPAFDALRSPRARRCQRACAPPWRPRSAPSTSRRMPMTASSTPAARACATWCDTGAASSGGRRTSSCGPATRTRWRPSWRRRSTPTPWSSRSAAARTSRAASNRPRQRPARSSPSISAGWTGCWRSTRRRGSRACRAASARSSRSSWARAAGRSGTSRTASRTRRSAAGSPRARRACSPTSTATSPISRGPSAS